MMLLAALLFAHPVMLAGLSLAALPLLIHLLLRPRPRHARFPALALLRQVVRSGQRASRVRNLLLLFTRMLLLATLALLLAGPTCTPRGVLFVGADPIAAAVVLDDSASTAYRATDASTRLELSRTQALEFLEQFGTWPPSSVITALRSGAAEPAPPLAGGIRGAADLLSSGPALPLHGRPLGAALREAAGILGSAQPASRRLVVFTDGTAAAWRDVTPAVLAGVSGLAVRVITPGHEPSTNLALVGATAPAGRHPTHTTLRLEATVAADGVDADCWLIVREAEATLHRAGPIHVSAAQPCTVRLEVPSLAPGPHALQLELEPPDRLDFDQRRALAVQVAAPPRVRLVSPPADGAEDLTALLIRNMLAPEVLPADEQLVSFERGLPTDETADVPALVVVLSGEAFDSATAAALLKLLERGSTVLLVPASGARDHDWPGLRDLLCGDAPVHEERATLTSLHWEPESRWADDPALAELARSGVRQRLLLRDLRAGAAAPLRYADGAPALVELPHGAGRLLLLTTSPDPRWSDLGIRAGGLLTLLYRLLHEALGPPDAVAEFALGESAQHVFAALPPDALVRVTPLDANEETPAWIRLERGVPRGGWPTQRSGRYRVDISGRDAVGALYVVNPPPEESNLAPITTVQLRQVLGLQSVELEQGGARRVERPTWAARVFGSRDLRRPLSGLLLLLFLFELALAARRPRAEHSATAT